jgi:ubiquinone/menaquinone biosynthesis C-methylase UbiE
MTAEDEHLTRVVFDVQRGLPRQGIGSDATTRQALALCAGLPATPDILDIGCGPGMQTVALALALRGRITAVDLNEEYLRELRARAEVAGVLDRVEVVVGDMRDLRFAPSSFDLLWSEGAAYVMGVGEALAAWRRLLGPGGCLAVSEMVWLEDDPPAEAAAFFGAEYPAMTDVGTNLGLFRASGYDVLGHFTLAEGDWWDHYYAPLVAKLPALRGRYSGDGAALAIVESAAREIDVRRRFPGSYGYEFFVARAVD